MVTVTFSDFPERHKGDYHICELKVSNTVASILNNCNSPVIFDSLEAGAYTFTVKAHDKYHNMFFSPPLNNPPPEFGNPAQRDWIIPEPDTRGSFQPLMVIIISF